MTSEAVAPEVEDVKDASTHLNELIARDRPTLLARDGREVGAVLPARLLTAWRKTDADLRELWIQTVSFSHARPGLRRLLAEYDDLEPPEAMRRLLVDYEDMKRRQSLRAEAEAARNNPDDLVEVREIMRELDEIDAR